MPLLPRLHRSAPLIPVLAALLLLGLPAADRSARAGDTGAIPPPNHHLPPSGLATVVARQGGLEGRVLWMDGTANFRRLGSRAGVASAMEHCVRAHVNTVVVDVKPLVGKVLYESRVALKLGEWKGWRQPAGYDLLRIALDEGHRRGLKVYANINVFSEGHKIVGAGPIYHQPDRQCLVYDVERIITTPRGERRALAVGANRGPGPNQISVYDANYNAPRVILPGEAMVLVLADRVESVLDGPQAPKAGINIPNEGYLLVGRGEGAHWLLQNLRVGDLPRWSEREKLMPIVDAPSETVAAFANPSHPEVRAHELKIVDEIATNYDIDGIVFDRMRYPSLYADFSPLSRQQFEAYLGKKLEHFPGDIYTHDPVPRGTVIQGPYFKQWLEWRAETIRTWLEQASQIIRTKRPNAKIGVYVGSWYGTYYTVGVNWACPDFAPGYSWMSDRYGQTAYAGLLDWITTGCYHPVATREQARTAGLDDNYTVQAAAELSSKAIGDEAFFYAGLYLQDYRSSPEAFREAIRAARSYSQGVMLFDLSHIEDYGWWPILEQEFPDRRTAPHDVSGLLSSVRAMHRAILSSGDRHAQRSPAPEAAQAPGVR